MPPQIDIVKSPSRAPVITQTQPPPTNEPAPTAEELQAAGKLMADALFGGEAVAPTPAALAPPEVPAPADPPAAPAPAAPAPAEPVPPAPPIEPSQPETDRTLETIQRTAMATAEAIADRMPQPAAPAPAGPTPAELTPEDAADMRVLRYMASKDPKLADLPGQFLAFVHKVYEYQDKWLAENQGQEFKWDDEAHAAWYAENSPDIDKKALDEARDDMRVEQKVRERLAPIEEREAMARIQPKINYEVNKLVVTMVYQVDPELGKLLRDANGNPDLRDEAIAKVQAMDPIAHDVLDALAPEYVPIMVELRKAAANEVDYKLDPARNPVHAAITRFIRRAEADILSAPAAQQIFDGKQFVGMVEMDRMRKEIQNGTGNAQDKAQKMRQLEANYTILTFDDVQDIIRDEFAQRAKNEISRIDALGKRKYGQNGHAAPVPPEKTGQPAPQPQPAAPAPTPATTARSGRPPSISSDSDVVSAGNPAAGASKTGGEQVVNVLFK